MKLDNRFIKKAVSILLAATLIAGTGFVPSNVAKAAEPTAKIDLLNNVPFIVKASSEKAANPSTLANRHDGVAGSTGTWWQNGSTGNFPAAGATSSLWLAVDLGAEKTFDEISFDIPTSYANVKLRMSDYTVLYTSTDNIWNTLPAKSNSCVTYDWSTNGWTNAKTVSVNDSNWKSSQNTGWISTSAAFSSVKGRYVMIHFTLINGSAGTMGMSNLRILSTPQSPTITPVSDSYIKESGQTLSTTVNLSGTSLSSITTSQAVYLAVYNDYTSTVTNGVQIITFKNTFLDSLPSGTTQLSLNLSNGFVLGYSINVIDGLYADTYLNNPGNCLALITPNYPGISLTIGHPAVIDANATANRFPSFNITKAVVSVSISGKLYAPNGDIVYNFPITAADGSGKATLSIPDSALLSKGTYKAEFALSNNETTLYDSYYFTAVDNFNLYKSIENKANSNNANVANVSPDSWSGEAYPAISMDAAGNIIYIPDYKGNQVMDYSSVGYKGGGAAIPNVPVRIKVSSLADNTQDTAQIIQDAIDYVSAYPLDGNGFRGAVYLEPGVFRISKPLYVNVSGVVIRGAGAGTVTPVVGDGSAEHPYDQQLANEDPEAGVTKLISTWKMVPSYTPAANHDSTTGSPYSKEANSTLINFNGQSVTTSVYTTVTDQYVGAGQFSLHVSSVEGLAVGDLVSIQKAVSADWARSMYMDKIDRSSNWVPNGSLESGFAGTPFTAERTIKKIDAATKTLTFGEPLSDNLDMRWGISKVAKIAADGRINNVGVENIQGISHFEELDKPSLPNKYGKYFDSYNSENHAEVFVAMVNVRDGWMRNFITYQIDTAFVTDGSSRNITVQDGSVLDPVSLMNAGERRYSIYYKNSSFMFTQRVYSRYMRHAFIVDSGTSGPNVFYNCSSEYTSNASEPHFRWSSGGLYDNVTARIYLQNRWDMGTSHGWAGVEYLLYNCTGPFIATQPQISPNYVIGHFFDSAANKLGDVSDPIIGRQIPDKRTSTNMANLGLNGGMVPNFSAYEYSISQKVTPAANNMPDSIYLQQLLKSHGSQALDAIAQNTVPDMIDKSSAVRPKLKGINVDGKPLPEFSPDTYNYVYSQPLDYDYTKVPEISAQAETGVKVDIALDSTGAVKITLTDANGTLNFYKVSIDTVAKSPIITASSQQVDSSNSNYAVNVLNTGDYMGSTSLRWAASGEAWIRMYLGDAKTLNGVQLGFVQNPTGVRSYNLRVEYSMDGRNWTNTPSGTVTSETYKVQTAWNCAPDGYVAALPLNPVSDAVAQNTLQTFLFDTPVQARFIRIVGNGNLTNSKYNAWNTYWRLRPVFSDGSEYTPTVGVSITGESTLKAGSSLQLNAVINPEAATIKDVTWKSSNTDIATVDFKGKVTGIAPGNVTITATTIGGVLTSFGNIENASSTFDLTVTKKPSGSTSNGAPGVIADSKPVIDFNKDSGIVDVKISADAFKNALSQAAIDENGRKVVTIDIPKMDGAKSYKTTLPAALLVTGGTQAGTAGVVIQINTEIGSIILPDNMLNSSDVSKFKELTLSISPVDRTKLSAAAAAAIGNRPAFDITISLDESLIQWNNQLAPTTVSIPYKPTLDELKNPEHIVVWYMDGNGKLTVIPSGRYNLAAGNVTFETTHFSRYAVGYAEKTFSDLNGYDWAKKQIEVLASKGIISGTAPETYAPEANITRADFMVLLTKTLGLSAETDSNFADVSKSDYYYNAVAIAKKLGLSLGDGSNNFRPNDEISRQDMMVIAAKALKYKNKLAKPSIPAKLDSFSDASLVAEYAKGYVETLVNEGLIQGDNNCINPLGNATRAEIAVLMYKIYNK